MRLLCVSTNVHAFVTAVANVFLPHVRARLRAVPEACLHRCAAVSGDGSHCYWSPRCLRLGACLGLLIPNPRRGPVAAAPVHCVCCGRLPDAPWRCSRCRGARICCAWCNALYSCVFVFMSGTCGVRCALYLARQGARLLL